MNINECIQYYLNIDLSYNEIYLCLENYNFFIGLCSLKLIKFEYEDQIFTVYNHSSKIKQYTYKKC